MLRILAGEEEATTGTISIPRKARVGVLRQDHFQYETTPILDVVMMGHTEMWQVFEEREQLLENAAESFNADRYGELEDYIQNRLREVPSERQASLRQELESMPVPSTRPAYGGVLADGAGNLWVSEWTIYSEVPAHWTVLDGSGRWLGEVALAERFQPFAIGKDWILGVEWDELDVEYVAVYPLRKGS